MFEVSQLPLDNLLLLAILQYLGAGNLFTRQDFVSRIRVTSTVNLLNLVAPFFILYPLSGHKGYNSLPD